MRNQFQQRILVIKTLGLTHNEIFQQLQVLNSTNNVAPYVNDYDLVTGFDIYERLWAQYRQKWDQQTRISLSNAKPIIDQLAYPPKALRWHTSLDKIS